jgi:CubicO group peptidase (beta-lactamase class C family)
MLPERPDELTYTSGGQGLWSTLDDYLAFARIFLGRGSVDGTTLLRPGTFALMTSNQLTPRQSEKARLLASRPFATGHGFGMGVAVVLDPEKAASNPCGGGIGAVGWPGGFGGWWRADPNDDSVLIFLSHSAAELDQLLEGIGLGAQNAISQFQSLASKRTGT